MKKLVFLLGIFISCTTPEFTEKFDKREVLNYEDRVEFICDSLGLRVPNDTDWVKMFTVRDNKLQFSKFVWYETTHNYVKIIVEQDSVDIVKLVIEDK